MDKAPELFQPLGGIRPRSSYTEDELAGMSPERHAAFDALYAAVEGEQRAEQNHKDALDAVKFSLAEVDRCKTALWKYAPKLDYMDIWRRDIKGEVPQFNPDDETAAKIKEAEIALHTAEENLQHARDAANAASMAIKPSRGRVATALSGYLARYPVKTGVDATKEVIATAQRQKELNKSQGRPASQNAPQPWQPASVLDAARKNPRASAGFSNSLGSHGAYPAHMKHRMVAPPKLPSDK